MTNKKIVFEEAIVRLEEIATTLEQNDISLDESLKLFEEGVRLGKFCESKLKDVEQKITILKSLDIDEELIVTKNQKTKKDNSINKSNSDDENNNDDSYDQKDNKEKQIKKNIDEDRELF
jgi:exodeoxyribonuclease VII small subunit